MKTMKEAGITRTMIIKHIVDNIAKDFNITIAQATEYFNEALAYNTVVEAIRENIEYRMESGHQLDWSNTEEETAYTDPKQPEKIKCFNCDNLTNPEDITTINGAMYCKDCTATIKESNKEETTQKLTGDYTLFIGNEETGRKTNFIEWEEQNSGSDRNGIIKTYYIKYASNRFPGEYEYYGMVWKFTLKNNTTGEKVQYRVGEPPQKIY